MIDLGRLARAVHLDAQRIGDSVYLVSGGATAHRVDLRVGEACDCDDRRIRGATCKHVLRAMLGEGDPDVLRALRDLVPLDGGRACFYTDCPQHESPTPAVPLAVEDGS